MGYVRNLLQRPTFTKTGRLLPGSMLHALMFGLVVALLIAGLIGAVGADRGGASSPPAPRNGKLDLAGWEPSRHGPLSLAGEWDFYWKRFVLFDGLSRPGPQPDLKAPVPSVWNRYELGGAKLPGFGYATYRLKVVNAVQGMSLALRVPTMSTAYRLFVGDRLVAWSGVAATRREDFRPAYRPVVVQVTAPASSFDIVVQVANFIYARGGMWYAISLGTPEQIGELDRRIIYRDLFLLGSLCALGLYYLAIFFLHREDRSNLYFVLLCLTAVGRTAIHGDYVLVKLFPQVGVQAIVLINYLTLYWFPAAFILLMGELFRGEIDRRAVRAAVGYALAATAITLVLPLPIYTRYPYLAEAAALAITCYALTGTMRALVRGKQDAALVLIGVLVMLLCAAYDILCHYHIIGYYVGETISWGFLIFLFLQAFILARRLARAFRREHELSERLLRMDRLKDEFLAHTSHELRTPLNGILAIAEALLQGSEGGLNAGQRREISSIAGVSKRLTNLVNDILDYSRLKHGDIKLDLRPLQINGIVQTVLDVLRQLDRPAGVAIVNALPADLPPVLADENRLAQIMYNLVGNAIKFTVQGHIRVTAAVVENMVEVCVEDTGQGIPGDRLTDIFQPFEQVDNLPAGGPGGTGLGLAITKQLVEAQGGTLRVESGPGQGSRFYFTLPVARGRQREKKPALPAFSSAVGIRVEQPVAFRHAGSGAHILLVDDQVLHLKSTAAILKSGGYTVTAVTSGAEALQELARHRDIALVVLDVHMPEMSGYEVCRAIRASRSGIALPVLMLTARVSSRDVVAGFEAGANDYLCKPVEAQELLARVKNLVSLKESADRAVAAEMAFLQAQIKPHFLFNVLNTISAFCDTDPGRAGSLIEELANYLRQSFDFKNLDRFIPLEREMELVRSYVNIEKARFGDELAVVYNIEQGIRACIPPLSIQPLVENAIRHGLRQKGGRGTVTISVRRTPAGVLVSVVDDGPGMAGGWSDSLPPSRTGSGVGLQNIDSRLKRLYGIGLEVHSEPGRGTEVFFIVPWGDAAIDSCHSG